MKVLAEEDLDMPDRSPKGVEGEKYWKEPKEGLRSDSDSKADTDLNILFERPSPTVVLLARNFSFEADGELSIILSEVPRKTPCTEPWISMPERLYTWLFQKAQYPQMNYFRPRKYIRLDRCYAGYLLQMLQLQLPAEHEYLKNFELLGAYGRLFNYLEPVHFRNNDFWCLKEGPVCPFTMPEILIFLKLRMIYIIDNTKDGPVIHEKDSSMLHFMRMDYRPTDLSSRRALQSFCDGAGPSNYDYQAKRYLTNLIRDLGPDFIVPACWAHLFEDKTKPLPDARTAKNGSSKSDWLKSFVRDSFGETKQPEGKRTFALRQKDDKTEKAKQESMGRRKSFRENFRSIAPWKDKGGEEMRRGGVKPIYFPSSNAGTVFGSVQRSSQIWTDEELMVKKIGSIFN